MQAINGVILEERPTDWLDLLRTGAYHHGLHNAIQGAWTKAIAVDTLVGVPFWVPRTTVWDRIAIHVTIAGAASSDARLGIYHDNGDSYPGALLSDCGLVDVDGVGLQAIVIDVQLTRGLYWTAMVSDGAPTVHADYGQINTHGALGPTYSVGSYWYVAQAFGALPDPFNAGASLSDYPPRIALRLDSFV